VGQQRRGCRNGLLVTFVGFNTKFAVTEALAFMVRQLAEIKEALLPVQPVKIWPAPGVAVRQALEPAT
jgi:hypothetical protein